LADVPGALLAYDTFEKDGFRYDGPLPDDISTITVNVDPAVTSSTKSDYTGISVTAANASRTTAYVLHSEGFTGSPAQAMERVGILYDQFMANYVVGEVNNGGDYIGTVLRQLRSDIKFKTVHASVGKIARAEPVAMLYEQGRVHHVGKPTAFATLEDLWCSWLPKGTKDDEGNEIGSDESPDEMDSVVWGMTELMLKRGRTVQPSKSVRG
jgi:phage terminase large subunit-like protein